MGEKVLSASECLRQILEVFNLKANELAGRIGVKPATISHIITGRNNPSYDVLQSILQTLPEINPAWLIQGKGEMLLGGGKPASVPTPSTQPENLNSAFTNVNYKTSTGKLFAAPDATTPIGSAQSPRAEPQGDRQHPEAENLKRAERDATLAPGEGEVGVSRPVIESKEDPSPSLGIDPSPVTPPTAPYAESGIRAPVATRVCHSDPAPYYPGSGSLDRAPDYAAPRTQAQGQDPRGVPPRDGHPRLPSAGDVLILRPDGTYQLFKQSPDGPLD